MGFPDTATGCSNAVTFTQHVLYLFMVASWSTSSPVFTECVWNWWNSAPAGCRASVASGEWRHDAAEKGRQVRSAPPDRKHATWRRVLKKKKKTREGEPLYCDFTPVKPTKLGMAFKRKRVGAVWESFSDDTSYLVSVRLLSQKRQNVWSDKMSEEKESEKVASRLEVQQIQVGELMHALSSQTGPPYAHRRSAPRTEPAGPLWTPFEFSSFNVLVVLMVVSCLVMWSIRVCTLNRGVVVACGKFCILLFFCFYLDCIVISFNK